MRKMLVVLLLTMAGFAVNAGTVRAGCGTVANDMSMTLPCVEYGGMYYKLTLKPWANPTDPSWLYWEYESIVPAAADTICAHVDAGLNITMPCLYYYGINTSAALEYYPAAGGLYWKLNANLGVSPVTISGISGDTTACIDMSYYASPEFQQSLQQAMVCIQQCGEDVQCLMGCMPDMGTGSSFSLAFTLCNPTGAPVEYVLPGGSYFNPGAADVQPMLVIDDLVYTLEPGCTTVCVPTYCMDGSAHAPSDSDVYGIADIAQIPCLTEILDFVRTAGELTFTESNTVQDAVWECMATGAITPAQRAALEALR
ncbi:MAG: hypothetical protein JW781_05590 [Deltaproteobacteria bacterium]|nr:hypothetical protein [Candidatus Anaeroferrophillacea bacterium]